MTSNDSLVVWQNCIISWFTPLVEVVLTHPLSIIKINLQQKTPIPWEIKGLYRGLIPNALGSIPTTAIQITATQWFEQDVFLGSPTYTQKICSALTSGVVSSVFSTPVELLITKLNHSRTLNLSSVARSQFVTYGLTGFFIGQVATALREGGFSIFFMAITPWLKNHIKSYGVNDNVAVAVAGACSGVLSTIVTQPLDVIKTQQQSDSFQKTNVGFFKTAEKIGFSNLWNGFLPRSSSIIISITFMTWFKEKLERHARENQPHDSMNSNHKFS